MSSLPAALSPWFRARCQDVPVQGAFAVLDLVAGGATVPFIARYRRDRTGNLDEAAVRRVVEAREQFDRLVGRQSIALESIERHATLTPELKDTILATFDPDVFEDLCLPFKQKKKSRAVAARLAGLGPLADWLWNCGHGTETPQEGQTLELWAYTFRAPDKGVPDTRTAIEGARDILVERLSEDVHLRALARRAYSENGWLRATKTDKAKPGSRFEPYFAFNEKVSTLEKPSHSHRYLAARRGQSEGELLLSIVGPPDDPEFEAGLISAFESAAVSVPDSPGDEALRQAARIAFKGVVRNAMENEIHRTLKEVADTSAAGALAAQARRVLLEAPFGPRPVLGVDAGVRTGGQIAVVDAAGACVASGAIQMQTDEEKAAARAAVLAFVREHSVAAIAIGSSAGGRQAELLLRPALREAGLDALVTLVSEAGAKVYSGGETGRAELPDLAPAVRSAVFFARRLQDPLRELVKIEPRHILGRQHAHDIAAGTLLKALGATLDSCIHAVGLDLNTAPPHMLSRISGLDSTIASAIVGHRDANGPFRSRQQLLELPSVDPRAFQQAAGFLRVPGGAQPLDATTVHPERYAALASFAEAKGKTVSDLLGPGAALLQESPLEAELGRRGREDVQRALAAPPGDPRGAFVPFAFREDLRTIEDLKPGMTCPGLVTNVTTFGAFVDIGLPHDGLVHVSQLGRGSGKDKGEKIRIGDRVQARVLKLDPEKRQISLTLKPEARGRRAPVSPGSARPEGRPKAAGARRRPEPGDGQGRKKPSRPRPSPGSGSGRRPAAKPPRENRPAFNNPFAVLADLKTGRGKS